MLWQISRWVNEAHVLERGDRLRVIRRALGAVARRPFAYETHRGQP
jgi:hypothetical protein